MIHDKIDQVDFEELEEELLELSAYLKEDDYDSAKELTLELLAETSGIYEEEEGERYFCFDSPLQYYIYDWKFSPIKQMKQSKIDYRTLHLCYAHILIEEESYEEAEEQLKQAIYWNPVDTGVLFEFARLYRKTGAWSKFLIVVRAARSYLTSGGSLAAYYANIGHYYLEKGEELVALSLFYLSDNLLPNPLADKGIESIVGDSKKYFAPPQIEEVREIMKKDELLYGVDPELISLIYDLSYELGKKLHNKEASYCLEVLYDLTQDEKYLREKETLF